MNFGVFAITLLASNEIQARREGECITGLVKMHSLARPACI